MSAPHAAAEITSSCVEAAIRASDLTLPKSYGRLPNAYQQSTSPRLAWQARVGRCRLRAHHQLGLRGSGATWTRLPTVSTSQTSIKNSKALAKGGKGERQSEAPSQPPLTPPFIRSRPAPVPGLQAAIRREGVQE